MAKARSRLTISRTDDNQGTSLSSTALLPSGIRDRVSHSVDVSCAPSRDNRTNYCRLHQIRELFFCSPQIAECVLDAAGVGCVSSVVVAPPRGTARASV